MICADPGSHTLDRASVAARTQLRRWRVLHGASQTVREQSGELCWILGYAAFGEKSCAVKQFGGFGQWQESSPRLLCACCRPVTSG